METIPAPCLDQLFTNARTHSYWLPKPVPAGTLERLYDLTKLAPTSANCQPLRVVFVQSPEGKARLKPFLDAGNVDKTMSAPVTAILAMDMRFYEHLPFLYPHTNARAWFEGNQQAIETTAFRNSTLQGGYFIMAARALGLDVGPMSGFDNAGVDREFFPDGRSRSNFLCNLGYGDPARLHPRTPRFSFSQACQVV